MFQFFRQLSKARVTVRAPRFNQIRKCCEYVATATSNFLVQKVLSDKENRMLNVTWNNESVSRYPYVFLRDNCRCSLCLHDSSNQRRFDTVGDLDLEIFPDKLEVTPHGGELVITWPDGHVSKFDSEWLHSRRLSEEGESAKKTSFLNKKGVEFWDAKKLQDNIPRSDFQEILEDDRALFDWLSSMYKLGIALVCNAPLKVGQVDKLCQRVGYAKPTIYGQFFQVKAKYGANNLAYTTDWLPLHTDLPYLDYPPGVQVLHCIEQVPSSGGSNQFVDGFYISKVLKEQDPKKFDVLSSTRLNFCDAGNDFIGEFDLQIARATIELDEHGQLSRFIHSNHSRDSLMTVSPERAIELYDAYVTIGKMMRDPANQIEYKMVPGDMVTFNNYRVMHGRTEFTVTEEGGRFLCGIYMDWDIIYSRLRALAKKLNVPSPC
ncbi:gamma-butyrobetaine dioxygenase-like [Acropora muricata]|uniref:gamma-butyrobetaine dioxygenase-like n=1 Tax=Acropora muricata TaxID=159855 RepID=UPI0034E50F1A